MPTISLLEVRALAEYIEELEMIIEEDDGTYFGNSQLRKHREAKEIVNALAKRKE